MLKNTFEVEAKVEEKHWWFVARRELFAKEILRAGILPAARVLDVGTSTGTNLRMLKNLGFHNVTGLDATEDAIRYCKEKGLGSVQHGDIAALPFDNGSYDLILATDVLEHVDDDLQALREIYRVLAPKGIALITVPCFMSLWGLQDEVSLHKRRYKLNDLIEKVSQSGLVSKRSYHFNYILFLPIWFMRTILRLFGVRMHSENKINTILLNKILLSVFRFDIATAHLIHSPVGVSALVIAEKL